MTCGSSNTNTHLGTYENRLVHLGTHGSTGQYAYLVIFHIHLGIPVCLVSIETWDHLATEGTTLTYGHLTIPTPKTLTWTHLYAHLWQYRTGLCTLYSNTGTQNIHLGTPGCIEDNIRDGNSIGWTLEKVEGSDNTPRRRHSLLPVNFYLDMEIALQSILTYGV